MSNVTVITHPLVQHKLTLMRKKDASTNSFRRLLGELSTLMAYEVTRDMPLQDVQIETPLETMTGKMIDGKKLVLVSILRAGNCGNCWNTPWMHCRRHFAWSICCAMWKAVRRKKPQPRWAFAKRP